MATLTYSLKTGIWKSVKNTLVVLLPAFGAGYAAFIMNSPEDLQPYFMAIGGFFAYLVKNYLQVKAEEKKP